jgi:hypothetical protein
MVRFSPWDELARLPSQSSSSDRDAKDFAHLETIHLARIAAPPPKHFCPTRGEQENRKKQAFVVARSHGLAQYAVRWLVCVYFQGHRQKQNRNYFRTKA